MEPRSRTQWSRLRRLEDSEIDYSDIPPTTPEFWARAVVVDPSRKVPISLRLDEDVLKWFKRLGPRYQTRINAVLRAYVDRYGSEPGAVREAAATYTDALLAELEVARERHGALENLRNEVSSSVLDVAERRIRAATGTPRPLKLPVLFFFLVRRDPRELRRFDQFLGRLRQGHRKRELPHLRDLLRSDAGYREPASALFEVEVLCTLLDAAPNNKVRLYPRIAGTPSYADAEVRLGHVTVYVEIKLLTQTRLQERIQDVGIASALGVSAPSRTEMEELRLASIEQGVVVGTGDPYADALRVMGKITEKPRQLHPELPNVMCLGLADQFPDPMTVEWAIKGVFSGSSTIADIAAEQTRDAGKRKTLERLAREARPEPRLAGVLVFDAQAGRAYPVRTFRNSGANPSNRLEERDWKALATLFGFPKEGG